MLLEMKIVGLTIRMIESAGYKLVCKEDPNGQFIFGWGGSNLDRHFVKRLIISLLVPFP